ncbi:MAG: hypothetical protein K8I29_10840 [Alphaproteobacteria bacterium]|uniref:Uncharacterized protein n=1 Tax=Candidatus Nitrobium versatile TaxID=2884831 RepID=A0A953J5F9_9BACT|nr:hypothetical protein [Candidatus Nitrobium versatile]
MQALSNFLRFFTDTSTLTIPFGQMLIFVVINSFCLLLGKYKLGLLVSYCFVLFWGFISNREFFIDTFGQTTWGLIIYVLSGIVMVVVLIIGFFQSSRE